MGNIQNQCSWFSQKCFLFIVFQCTMLTIPHLRSEYFHSVFSCPRHFLFRFIFSKTIYFHFFCGRKLFSFKVTFLHKWACFLQTIVHPYDLYLFLSGTSINRSTTKLRSSIPATQFGSADSPAKFTNLSQPNSRSQSFALCAAQSGSGILNPPKMRRNESNMSFSSISVSSAEHIATSGPGKL